MDRSERRLSPAQQRTLRKLAGGARLLAGRTRRESVLFDDLETSRRSTLERLISLGYVRRASRSGVGSGDEYEITDLGRAALASN